ncbi:MAG: LamG-like jellyroll fold domain-containing protein, partial [Candidatus Izemoplasmatales bacterium]
MLALDAANPKSYPGSGTTWNDLSGNGNDGVLVNGPTFDSGNNVSLVFDGVNDYINIPYDASFNSSNITVECVTNFNSKIHVRPIVNRSSSSSSQNDPWRLLIVNVEFYRFQFNILVANQVYSVRSNFEYNTSSIYHVTSTYDGTSLKMFVNDILQDTLLVSGNLDSSINDIEIARNSYY